MTQPLREKLAADAHRPQYHFLPPANWMNDPNGLIQWQDHYHLFYQHNPNNPAWGPMHWGHAVSQDLVHWTDLPNALAPTPGTADEDGCWSGYAVNHQGTPTLLYTGLRGQIQLPCLATSRDNLLTWQKYAGNPVIASPPPELDVVGFRDHTLWPENGAWYQLIGSGIRDVGGTALLYQSSDLKRWQYLHPITIGDKNETGEMWECPDFFPLGDKHVLIVSPIPLRRALYFVGIYADHHFTPDVHGTVDAGGHFYAPLTMQDENGRRLMWGWLWEGRSEQAQQEAGWAGVMSLPRILSLPPGGSLSQFPVPELAALRNHHFHLANIDLTPGMAPVLADVSGDTLEILAEFEPLDGGVFDAGQTFGLKVRCSPDGAEQTLIVYDGQEVAVDRQRASLDVETHRDRYSGPLQLASGETLTLHVFLDRSVIELFANYRTCLASRIYPSRPDSLGLDLFVRSGRVRLKSLDVWSMASIWA